MTDEVSETKHSVLPKVSVIVPVYNMEPYLAQCLDSILSQSLKNIEIICIDDGSSDRSLNILHEYQRNHESLIIITQNNLGSGPSRNKGISLATGEFVAFMDSDDWYPEPDILETMYNSAIKNKISICGGSASMYRNGKMITTFRGSNAAHAFNKEGIIKFSEYQYPWGYWRFLYSREFIQEHNILFPNYRRGQDPPFFVNAMIAAKKFYAMTKVTYCYRVSHKKIGWDRIKINDYLMSILDLLTISQKHDLSKLYTFAIKQFIWTYGKCIINNLDSNNKVFLEKVSEYNKIVGGSTQFQEHKNTHLDKYLIKAYSHVLLKCSPGKRPQRVISCIKCNVLSLYWAIRDRTMETTRNQ